MKKKQARRRFFIFFCLYSVIAGILIHNIGTSVVQIYSKNKEKKEFEVKLAELKEKEDIQRQIDAMTPEMKLKVKLDWQFGGGKNNVPDGTGWAPGFANGIYSVPYDGMLARLHKNERVVPAREVSSRNYSSNLYVESMYMNGGTDAAGLAAAMAAAQRRQMSGYGS